ncbi:hypothetical protein [Enterococcus thailandicus]|uniref:Uncharacterized protein n=1 Tax=Enterococcus thailandicus TaxID=417368 RepID=A0A510WFS5_ENTTH|nr:hypothetical protein [Enterococcus thailandicus]MDA3973403.1 hypothetical protein [Enterococcus thailandicus]MDA3976012.1 hypothetical protein [Enterococcus thailandicus]MDA3980862.1 hypothetical protein [Enterococcus thailandicus]MDK4351699.1 hypothetical protein [Enterococcus thailandicus]MDT2734368.1 hypothetical protein [Enterococcus thailandicus]
MKVKSVNLNGHPLLQVLLFVAEVLFGLVACLLVSVWFGRLMQVIIGYFAGW